MGSDYDNHYLDKYGCSFGQVNRSRLEDVEAGVKAVNTKLSWLLYLLIAQLTASVAYMVIHWRPGP